MDGLLVAMDQNGVTMYPLLAVYHALTPDLPVILSLISMDATDT